MRQKWKNSLPWILLVCLLLTAAVALHAYYIERDRYAATYTLYALPADADNDVSALENARMLTRDCRALLQTEAFRAILEDKRQLDATCAVNVSGVDGTHLSEITATSEDAQLAGGLANAIGEEMTKQARDVLLARDVTELERAVEPDAPYTPNRVLRIVLAGVSSFLLLSLLGGLLGSSRERARYRRSSSASCGEPLIIGGLPSEREIVKLQHRAQKRSGTGTLYSKASELMVESLRELMLRLRAIGRTGEACVIAMSAANGESAAPALLLASALAEQRHSVLLIDMDGDAHELGDLLGVRGKRDLADYLAGESTLGEILLATPVRDLTFVDGLKASGELSRMLATRTFEQFVSAMRAGYDYVLMHARPVMESADTGMVGMTADLTLLIAENGRCDLGALRAAASKLTQLSGKPVGVVLTRVPDNRL